MNSYFKISLLLFMFSCSGFSQKNTTTKLLNDELVKTANKNNKKSYFKKATFFFVNEKWDSTLVYSKKHLLTSNSFNLNEFTHFIRGYSFDKKHMYPDAEREYKLVTKNNKLYHLTKTFLGLLALEQKQFESAINYFEALIDLPEQEYYFIKKSSIVHNLGLCHLHLKNFKEAEHYLTKSIQLLKKDTLALIGAYGDIAGLYYEQYKDDLAIPYFEKAHLLANKTKSYNSKYITSTNMAVIEENRKDFKKALVYRKEAQQWKDSLNDQNKIYAVAQAEKEFAVAAKQKEVDYLQVQNQLKESERKLFLYSAIGLLLLLGVGLYFYQEKIKTNKVISAQKETLDELNATKDKLFSIVSHDLRSSVNALKNSNSMLLDNVSSKNMEALENLVKQNSAIVNGAYGLLDNLLNWALLQTNQGYFQIDALRLFIIVEHVAYNYKPLLFEKELTFENSVTKKAIALADQESLKIILRNLLDNAIKFSKPNGALKIYVTEAENYWNLIVEDNGLGINENTKKELLKETALLNKKEHEDVLGTGLGLSLVKSMIAKNHGKFDIESELGKGTKMIVSLPKYA